MAASSRSEPKRGSLSFFKVVRDGSAPHLRLPSAFVRRHLEKIPENPILKTAKGEHSWRLKIEEIDGNYCFAHGWEKLVKDAQLRPADILVFWLIDPFTFQVSIFDAVGCEKDLPSKNTNFSGDGDDEEEKVMRDENPSFQKAISEKTHKYIMTLPRKFVVEAGMGSKSVVTIKDLEGKEWIVGLVKYALTSGWSLFREYNELSDGDICSFKFIKKEGVLSLTQVLKNKEARKQECQHQKIQELEGGKRERGRPRLEKPRGGGGGGVKIEDESSPEGKRKRGRPPLEKVCGGGGGGGGGVDVKIEDESGPEVEMMKRKRGRPLLEKPRGGGGGVEVKIEDESGPKVETVKRKKGRPPLEKPRDGGVDVKVEDEPGPEVEVVKNKRGRPPLEKPRGGGVDVKIEDESGPEVEVVKKTRGRPSLGKRDGGGVVVKIEDKSNSEEEAEVVKRKRGRPPLGKPRDGGVEVKTEDEPAREAEAMKRKRGRPPLDREVRNNRVEYF